MKPPTYAVGATPEFLEWCRKQCIKSCLTAGVRHIPDRAAAEHVAAKGVGHKVILLNSADPDVVFYMKVSGFNIPVDPLENAKAERIRLVDDWAEKMDKWVANVEAGESL